MRHYIVMRFLQSLLALLILSLLIFLLARATGDPLHLILPMQASEEDYANARRLLGLDKPLPVQYWVFISRAVRGDFGMSLRARKPVKELLFERLPNSVKLAAFSLVVSLVVAFPLGVVSAVKKGTKVDTAANVIAVLGQSLPAFWVGILLIEVVAGRWQILPAGGTGGFSHYLLPGFTLGWFVVAGIMRLLRSSMLDVLDSEYIKLARAKGLPEWKLLMKYPVRVALNPIASTIGWELTAIIAGAPLVSFVLALPDTGPIFLRALLDQDIYLSGAILLMYSTLTILGTFLSDVLLALLDPRIRYGERV